MRTAVSGSSDIDNSPSGRSRSRILGLPPVKGYPCLELSNCKGSLQLRQNNKSTRGRQLSNAPIPARRSLYHFFHVFPFK